ncbi:MAG: response regulator [Okeania sp. SIO2F4]|uniref:response regulator n=1 Tax=Okeania sp. SIO2F4 TaxID=2607790 RepID=UPI00142C2620|nr:response regulator [Okeania sp. SIO2F4]NES04084.1 response regulator [Okeania sp. SIO2F4]
MSETESIKKTILAVDDSKVMHEMIRQVLGQKYRVLVADNAVDGLSMIYHEQVAVLLLDVSMPGIDGLELCRTLRSIPQFQTLPIIMLTARDNSFDKVQGHLAGATEYLTKPFDAEKLNQLISSFLN